jgi:hypothetical protein
MGGSGLAAGEFNLRFGLTSGYAGAVAEYGFGIRPFNQNAGEPNIVRSYATSSAVYAPPTVGAPSTIPIIANTWYRVTMIRTGTGNTTAIMYGLDEDGNVFLTANLGGHTNANLPTTANIRPFFRLESTSNGGLLGLSGPVSMLVDYFSYQKSLTR